MKHYKKLFLPLIFFILLIVSTLFIGVSLSWFTSQEEYNYTGQMGFVDVDLEAFFVDEFGQPTEAIEVEITPGVFKKGVYRINITSNTQEYFIEDLRVNIIVKSNIDTYFRVEIYEQLTFIYTNSNDEVIEMAVPYEVGVDLNYNTVNWYDNRIFDNYIYYTEKVTRISQSENLVIPLIDSYFQNQNFDTRSPGYSLQMAFSVEAVQAEGGPENNWDLVSPPWGGAW
ncbi:MAG: hypothetical protein AB7E09_02210 [Candidatus Izemoplasmatales bacterium]